MAPYSYVNPEDPTQYYDTIIPNNPNVPAGYILTGGSDHSIDRDLQTFVPGACSGGFPRYPSGTGNPIETDLRELNGTGSTGR